MIGLYARSAVCVWYKCGVSVDVRYDQSCIAFLGFVMCASTIASFGPSLVAKHLLRDIKNYEFSVTYRGRQMYIPESFSALVFMI